MSNYTEKRLGDYVERFDMLDDFIDRIEALPGPSSELLEAIVELKAMRNAVKVGVVAYLEAPYLPPPPPEDDP